MNFRITHIDETDSTNRWVKDYGGEEDMVVWTDFQTAGRDVVLTPGRASAGRTCCSRYR